MSSDPSAPLPTPTHYQRTAGGSLCWQPPTPEHLQEMLPSYEVLSILGQGGMGAVYKGRQKSLDRVVAIKILPPEAAEDDMQFAERFKNEARTMAKMNHPAIVHVYDFGETTESQFYIVMEFIDGTDVAKMIQSQGKLPEDYALSITAHVCDALGYAHTQGVVHRDIKPANVLITMAGQIKVADFGLAKATDPSQMGLTKTNMAMGTPDFVSPEALMPGVPLDGRADLYAVGVMLYNMLTGTIPRGAFRMPSATLQTDARFDKIILKSMEMDRENRYQTALDLRRDLDVILTTPAAKSGGQTLPAQAALPQKPMGKSPSAPQQRPAASTGTPGRAAPAAGKPAATPAAAPAKKSNAALIYGIAASVVVIAGGAFMFSGGKKPVPAPKAVTVTKPEIQKQESKPVTPAPAVLTHKPAESKPAPAPAAVAAGNEKWVDGLAQWFGGTKTNNDYVREGNGARVGADKWNLLAPIPISSPNLRDQVARVRWRGIDTKTDVRLHLRNQLDADGKDARYSASVKLSKGDVWEVRLTGPGRILGNRDWPLPPGFKIDETHTMEFRIIGDLLTASLDGKKIVEFRDTQLTDGHPAVSGHEVLIESFEYANLDPGDAAPALVTAKSSPASRVEPVMTNTLGMKFVPVPITGGPTGGQRVLFSVWETRVQDYSAFATGTKREWPKPEFEQGPTHPAVNVSWEDAQAFCMWLTERERKAGKVGANELYRLPSDHEWSCAVGIGDQEDAAKLPSEKGGKLNDVFPWGTQWPPPKGAANYAGEELRPALAAGKVTIKEVLEGYNDGFVNTAPVGSFAANRFGFYDLGGNVWQWCEDWADATQKDRVLRGASWNNSVRSFLRSSCRTNYAPGTRSDNRGFRCVLAGSVATAAAPPAAAPTPALAPTMPAAAPAPAPAAPMAPADPRLAQLAVGFKTRHDADALQPFNTAMAALNTSYLANGVSRARAVAKAKGNLAEVTALDAEKTAIVQGRGVPAEDEADTPESLKTLRGTYRTAFAKFATERDAKAAPLYDLYLKALDAYIAELTQADKIDAARQVQVFRDDIAAQKPGAGAAAPPTTAKGTTSAPAASAPAKPAVLAPKMSDQEVAEWAIATGGSVDVVSGTPEVKRTIAIASELPRGRFVITAMEVKGDKVPGRDLSPLASARSTGHLVLWSQLPDKTFLDITPLRQMTSLYHLRCGNQDAAGMDVIASLSELTFLDIGMMPEGSFEKIAKMKNLDSLESPSITGPGIAALKGCKKLLKINNRGLSNPVTDDDVRVIVTALPELEMLSLGNARNGAAPITNACVPSLLALKSLKRLGLNGKGIDDSALETVAKLRTLEYLGLEATQVTGSGFKALTKLVLLKELFLIRTPITDAALEDLAKLKTLKILNLQETTVSEAAVAKLQAALPDCKITTK